MKTPLLIAGLTVLALPAFMSKAGEPLNESGYRLTELCSVDLAVGRKLRMRLYRIEPGTATMLFEHDGSPAVSYVVRGTILSRRAGSPDRVLHEGDGLAEARDAAPRWLLNNTGKPAEFVSADIAKP